MKNIWVTGSNGQLGSALKDLSIKEKKYNWFFTDIDALDLTKQEKVLQFVQQNKIEMIINCAAFTNVDKAEDEQELAFQINFKVVKHLGEIAKEYQIKLIHISTDYVFDGNSETPYLEHDVTNPQSVYGKSKLEGENALISMNIQNSIIIRTAWLYGNKGHNFVKTILNLADEKDEIRVVNDQIGSPTYAQDLAETIINCLPKINNYSTEIYHFSNDGICSWFDFAKKIIELKGLSCKVVPVSSEEFNSIAKRPKFSLLNSTKIQSDFGIQIKAWEVSLEHYLKKLSKN